MTDVLKQPTLDRRETPNVILILADDMGFSDLGCTGGETHTPHIDGMAERGVLLTAMYNCARCCPTRAALLTGLYPHKAGVGHMTTDYGKPAYQGYLRNDSVTIAEVLRGVGYRTLMSGKWHVGGDFQPRDYDTWTPGDMVHPTPRQRGFDRFFGTLDGAGSFFHPHFVMRDDTRVEIDAEGFYLTDAISEQAVSMVEQAAAEQTPFFLYLAYTAPHWPLQAWPEDIARYDGGYRKGWDAVRTARHENMLERGVLDRQWTISSRDPQAPAWVDVAHQDWEAMRMAVYAAQVDRMDQGVGRVLSALRRLGLEDDTLVMFLSDNGGCAEFLAEDGWPTYYPTVAPDGRAIETGNRPGLRPGSGYTFMSYDLPWANVSNTPFKLFKHWVHEGGISTPLIAHWPNGIEGGRIDNSARHVVDIMPTILEVTGATYPTEFGGHSIQASDGESLLAVLRNADTVRERPIFWEHEGNAAVRLDEWKLVRRFGQDFELYNMHDDRTERRNLAKQNRPECDRLVALFDAWTKAVGVIDWSIVERDAMRLYTKGQGLYSG